MTGCSSRTSWWWWCCSCGISLLPFAVQGAISSKPPPIFQLYILVPWISWIYKWEFLEMVWCSSKKRLRNVECCCIVIICKGNVVLSSILKLPNLTGHINYSAHKTKVKFTWKLLQKKVDKHFKYLSTTYVFTNNSTVIV